MCVLDGKLYSLLRLGLFDFRMFDLACAATRHLLYCNRLLESPTPLTQKCGSPLYRSPEIFEGQAYNEKVWYDAPFQLQKR